MRNYTNSKKSKFQKIQSPENKKFKLWKSLLSSSGIKKHNLTLIQGTSLVNEYLEHFFDSPISFLFPKNLEIPPLTGPQIQFFELSPHLFEVLNVTGSSSPILCVPIPLIKPFDFKAPAPPLRVFLPLGDPKNLGVALRNCLAFKVHEVVLLKESAHPFLPLCIKASSSIEIFKLQLLQGPHIHDLTPLKPIVLNTSGDPLHQFSWPPSTQILVGEEGLGVPDSLKETCPCVSIPHSQKVESLNASQTLGICLYQYFISQSN